MFVHYSRPDGLFSFLSFPVGFLCQGAHSTAINRKRRAWSESDEDDEPLGDRVTTAETDEETNGIKAKGVAGDDDEGDD